MKKRNLLIQLFNTMKKRNLLILGFLIAGSLLVLEFEDPILSGAKIGSEIGPQLSPEGLNPIDKFENDLLLPFIGNPMFFNKFMIFFDEYVNIWVLIIVGVLLILFYKKDKNKRFLSFISSIFCTSVVVFLLKILFHRSRPLTSLIEYPSFAFPSGHAAVIFSVLPLFVKKYPNLKYYFYVIVGLVLYNRVYLGVHYFSDLVFGAFIGYSIGLFLLKKFKI